MRDQVTALHRPSAAELAAIEGGALPEWERLAVQDYWDAVIAEELGSVESPVSVVADSTAERTRLRRSVRRGEARVLRLVAEVADEVAASSELGEVA